MTVFLLDTSAVSDNHEACYKALTSVYAAVAASVLRANVTTPDAPGASVTHVKLHLPDHRDQLSENLGSAGPIVALAPLSLLATDSVAAELATTIAASPTSTLFVWGDGKEIPHAPEDLRSVAIRFEAQSDGTVVVADSPWGRVSAEWALAEYRPE